MKKGRLEVGEERSSLTVRARETETDGPPTSPVHAEKASGRARQRGCEIENEPGNGRAEENTSKDADIKGRVTSSVNSQFRNKPLKRILVNFLSNRALALEISSNAGRMQSTNPGHTNQCWPA